MDYKQFKNLMETEEFSGKDSVNLLQDFVKEFPYFQTAQILLAKAMHDNQHVRYERQLKIASSYSGDRKSLYNLIHKKHKPLFSKSTEPAESAFKDSTVVENEIENLFIDHSVEQVIPPDIDVFQFAHDSEIVSQTPSVSHEESVINEEEDQLEDNETPVADPHEIIRKRLNEILGLKPAEKEKPNEKIEPISVPVVEENLQEEIISLVQETANTDDVPEIISSEPLKTSVEDVIEKLTAESDKELDFIDRAELEYALESTLIHSLEKLPIIERQKEAEIITKDDSHFSFYDWLRVKSTSGFGEIEEVHAYDNADKDQSQSSKITSVQSEITEMKLGGVSHIIDQFIKTEPRIVPSKVEFYSPASQAKKSVTEDEDLVSETLAKIYRMQGNLIKARSSYQKLSLLFPEKMAYFAALILDIDKEINNLDKKDL